MELQHTLYLLLFTLFFIEIKADTLLKGRKISSDSSQSIKYAFDNRLETQYISENETNGWVGMNFLEENIITKIQWGIKNANHSDYLLGIFEASTKSTFEDAIPLYMITEKVEMNDNMNTIDVSFTAGFNYMRYIGPSGSYCKINNIRIYGQEYNYQTNVYKNYKPSNLPLVVIHSISGLEPTKDNKIDATFYIINEIDVKPKIIYIKLQLKGIENLNLYKKSYYLYFKEPQKVLDFSHESDKWALVSNYYDKTLIRNLVSFEISKMIGMKYTVECHPVDVMVNGEYKGTYNLCEKIEISENKINIIKMTNYDNQEPEISGGYLLEINGFAFAFSDKTYFNSIKGIPISFREPEDITEEQRNYIIDKYYEYEIELYDNNLTRIDIHSFVKYFLLEEIIGNDMAYWSTFIYKNRNDEKFYFGPIWDNDMSLENDKRSYPTNCKTNYVFNYGIASGNMDKVIKKILKNEKVKEEIKNVFQSLIDNNIMDLNYLNEYIDNTVELIRESRKLNFMRWNILKEQLNNNPKIYNSFEEEIDVIKNFIKNRMIWLKDFILDIKCVDEGCNICEKTVDSQTSSSEDYDYSHQRIQDDDLGFQSLYYKSLKINLFNVLSRIAFTFLL